jgi:N-methylhydantoinase A
VHFKVGGGRSCPIFRRGDLGAGTRLRGPALVEEENSVTLVHPGRDLEVTRDGMLIITGIETATGPQRPHAATFRG